ncbi:MAG: sulfite exporter TauE/SafE family protein [Solirubrobacteraceae bacterium MAG38_C4-C5]|nr:sulfite exporter TauE/SafE family protein [Candidatus Siliceabacter maunaloa]
MTILLAALAVGAGAVLQSATGFGFAIVAAPALVALVGPEATVSALSVLALVINGLTLAGERRRPRPAPGDAAALVAWALPGLAVGALALATLPERALEAAVGAAVLAALGVRVATRWGGPQAARPGTVPRLGRGPRRAAAGILSGSLATSTGLSGPPLVLYLTGRSLDAARVRDTLAVVFLAQGALGLAALAFFDTLALPEGMAVLAVAAVAGQATGRRAFAALRTADRFEPVLLGVLALAGLAALASGLF